MLILYKVVQKIEKNTQLALLTNKEGGYWFIQILL